jgi:hypothetical protein
MAAEVGAKILCSADALLQSRRADALSALMESVGDAQTIRAGDAMIRSGSGI